MMISYHSDMNELIGKITAVNLPLQEMKPVMLLNDAICFDGV